MTSRKQAAEATRLILASVWEKNLPLQRERLLQLETASKAASEGSLKVDERKAAGSTAHKMAGSLGMFGYAKGTDLARELEVMLDGPGAVNPTAFSQQVTALRAELGL